MDKQELGRIDDQGMKAWNDHDPEAFLALFADGFVWRDITLFEPITTAEGVRQYMGGWFTAFPDMQSRTINRIIGEDAVAAELEFTGTNTGPLDMGGPTIPATGRSVVGTGSYFVRVDSDGKVAEFSTHPDVAGMLMQLGLIPMESEAPTA